MTVNAIFYVIGVLLYLSAAYGIYKSLQDDSKVKTNWIKPAIACALLIHLWLIYEAMFTHGATYFGMALALSITVFCCTCLLLIENLFTNLSVMLLVFLPITAICMLLPLILPGNPLSASTATVAFCIHLLLALCAYSMVTMALVQAVLLVALHNQVHSKKIGENTREGKVDLISKMPSMMEMEKLLFRDIWAGVIVLTVVLIFGFINSYNMYGQAIRFDHMTFVGILSWVIFVILLFGHYVLGWRSKVAATWTVIGFFFLMGAYVGIRFILEVIR